MGFILLIEHCVCECAKGLSHGALIVSSSNVYVAHKLVSHKHETPNWMVNLLRGEGELISF